MRTIHTYIYNKCPSVAQRIEIYACAQTAFFCHAIRRHDVTVHLCVNICRPRVYALRRVKNIVQLQSKQGKESADILCIWLILTVCVYIRMKFLSISLQTLNGRCDPYASNIPLLILWIYNVSNVLLYIVCYIHMNIYMQHVCE